MSTFDFASAGERLEEASIRLRQRLAAPTAASDVGLVQALASDVQTELTSIVTAITTEWGASAETMGADSVDVSVTQTG